MFNVTIKQVRAFVAVAKTNSFAEAAGLVHLSQPALSITIRNLEQALGGPLLVRSTRTLALTPEGQSFLPVAERLLLDWDEGLRDVHAQFALRRGRLSMAAMPSFASNQLPLVLGQFRRDYPHIDVSVHDVVAETAVEYVRSGRVELAIAFEPDESHDLRFVPLFEDRFIAVLPPDHPLAAEATISWPLLQGESLLALQRPSATREMIDQLIAAQQLRISIEFESHQLATIGRMVAVGLGVSVVPALCRQQMTEMKAVCRPLVEPELVRAVGVVSRSRYPLSSAGAAMLAKLRESFKTD